MKTFKTGPKKPPEQADFVSPTELALVGTTIRIVPKVREALDKAARAEGVSRNLKVNEILAAHLGIDLEN